MPFILHVSTQITFHLLKHASLPSELLEMSCELAFSNEVCVESKPTPIAFVTTLDDGYEEEKAAFLQTELLQI